MTDLLQDNLLYLHQNKKDLFQQIEAYLADNQGEKMFKLMWEDKFPNITFSSGNGIKLLYDNKGNDLSKWINEYQFLQNGQYDVVMYGLGLSYHLVKLIEMNPELNFYIFEPETDLFVETLKVINIQQLLEHPKVKLLYVGNEISDMDNFIYLKNLYSCNTRVNICLPFYIATNQKNVISFYDAEYRGWTIEAVEKGLEYNFGTLLFKNSIRNIEYLYYSNSLELLKGKYKNCTALVVGGGPSLEKDIAKIKEYRDSIVIIAAGSSVQALLQNGIEPHIIATIDGGEANGRVFENTDTTNIPLVFVNQLYTPILENHSRLNYHTFFASDPILNYVFEGKQLTPKFISTTSVSGTAVQIAAYLGATTIIFTGQDLSFPNKQYYAAGATHVNTEALEKQMSTNTLKVENVHGQYNDTNYSLKVTLEDIEELIKLLDNITFINSSSLGAKIKGADFLPFEEVVASLVENKYDFSLIKQIAEQPVVKNSFVLDDLMSRVSTIQEVCDVVTVKCETSIRLIKKIDETSRTHPNKAMSTLSKLENEFSQVTKHNIFKLIITQWNRGITREYDQKVSNIEKEPTMIGKAKLLNEILLPYIETIIISLQEIKEEFQKLNEKLKI